MPDAAGVMRNVYDETNRALRVSMSFPGQLLGRAEGIINTNGIGVTFTNVTGLAVPLPAAVLARAVNGITLEAFLPQVSSTASPPSYFNIAILEDAVIIAQSTGVLAASSFTNILCKRRGYVPVAGNHTYTVQVQTGSNTVSVTTGTTVAPYLAIEAC